jgi:hypothetical protein
MKSIQILAELLSSQVVSVVEEFGQPEILLCTDRYPQPENPRNLVQGRIFKDCGGGAGRQG